MSDINWNAGDDLSDMLGTAAPAPRVMPQDEAFARIRAQVPTFTEKCPKCQGRGRFVSYAGRDCGPCFKCKGRGSFTFKSSAADRAQAREKAADRKVARADANVEAYKAAKPQAWDHMVRAAAKWEYAARMMEAIAQYGDLTPPQQAVIDQSMVRSAQWEQERQEARTQAPSRSQEVDVSLLWAAFQKAKDAGNNEITLRFEKLVIFEARKHPGTLYVKAGQGFDATYYGKIVDGRFFPSRECTPEVQAHIVLVASDPAAAARVYGHTSGQCSCCGRRLDNPKSVAMGIGPICAAKYGF